MLRYIKRRVSECVDSKGTLPEFQEVELGQLEEPPVASQPGSVFYDDYLTTPSPTQKSPNYSTLTIKDNTFAVKLENCPGAKIVLNEIVNAEGIRVFQPASSVPEEIYVTLGAIKLIESLKILYKTEEGFFIPFPWMRNSQYEADHYIPLQLDEWSRTGTRLLENGILLDNLFQGRDRSSPPSRVLITAEPGNGKTTVCIRLAYLWANENESSLSRFKMTILVRLRNIKDKRLEDYVLEFCHKAMLQNSAKTIQNILTDLGNELLLILDGLDETPEQVRQSVLDVLGFNNSNTCQSFLRGATILTTSRPGKNVDNSRLFDRRIRIEGILPNHQNDFIDKYIRDHRKAMELKTLLSGTIFSRNVSPLTLTILCYLKVKNRITEFQTEWELIGTILNTLGELCVAKEQLSLHGTSFWAVYYRLGEIYFRRGSSTVRLTEKELTNSFSGDDLIFITSCGILARPPRFDNVSCGGYEPLHKKFAEFLIASHLKWEWHTNFTFEARKTFLNELIQPCLVRDGIKAYDVNSSTEVKFTFSVLKGAVTAMVTVKGHPAGQNPALECEFFTSSYTEGFYEELKKKQPLVKVRSILKVYRYSPLSDGIPPQFGPGLNCLCPTDVYHKNGVLFTYNIYRDSKLTFEPHTLAIKDHSVKEIIFFEYAEHSSVRTPTVSMCHGKKEIEIMLKRAIDNSAAVICTSLFFNFKQMVRLFPETEMHTLETVGDYAVMQNTLRQFVKHYLKCKQPFYAVPEDALDVRDFVSRFFQSLVSCTVTTNIVATWNYHGHVFQCVHDPVTQTTRAYHAKPEIAKRGSVPLEMGRMVDKMASVAQGMASDIFHIQLNVSIIKVSLLVNLREQLSPRPRTVTWKILKARAN